MKLHNKIARIFGYEIIKRRKHPSSDTHLINLLNQYRIDTVLDVGANYGQFGKMLRSEGYQGEIHSFEPVSATYNVLSQAAANDKKWLTYQSAMSESCGEASVNVTESSDLSSFLQPSDFGKQRYKKMRIDHTETVTVSTLDTFFTTTMTDFSTRRLFLKMDTQGFDLKVFKGVAGHLQNIIGILSEISFTPIYADMPHYLESLKMYEDHGFVVTGLYPISREKDLSVVEMDCMLINTNHS